jgi:hypothetical protein
MLSDLSCRLGINFPARQRGEFIADIHHGVTAFALAVIDSKTNTERASLTPDFRDEAVSLVHAPPGFAEQVIGHFCPNVNRSDEKVPFELEVLV